MNGFLAQERPTVASVVVGTAGEMIVEWTSGTRLEAFPDCSGPVEAWRVFVRDGRHYVFPAGAA